MTAADGSPLAIVFLDRESLPEGIVLRPPAFAHRLTAYPRSAREEVAARIAGADVVITNKVRVLAEAIAGARRLKLVAVSASAHSLGKSTSSG